LPEAAKQLFPPDTRYLAYQIIPTFAETRQAKKKKLKEDKCPGIILK